MPDAALSVVICAYTEQRWDDLIAAVRSVAAQDVPPLECLVVVDHNEALLARATEELSEWATVIPSSGPKGLSGARNTGVEAARGDVVAFLDDDAVAERDWTVHLLAPYADPDVLGVGGWAEAEWLEGEPGWFPEEFLWVVGCSYRGLPTETATVRNLIGCNMSFRREVFAAIGGFRIGRVGALSIGQENDETELCIRLAAARPGAILRYLPDAVVQHSVPMQRATLRYFVRRCFSEGMSKAALARQAGAGPSLSTERAYVRKTLPAGVGRGLRDAARGDLSGLLRAGTIVAGLAVTGAGYLMGLVTRRGAGAARPSAAPGVAPVETSPGARP